MLPAGL